MSGMSSGSTRRKYIRKTMACRSILMLLDDSGKEKQMESSISPDLSSHRWVKAPGRFTSRKSLDSSLADIVITVRGEAKEM